MPNNYSKNQYTELINLKTRTDPSNAWNIKTSETTIAGKVELNQISPNTTQAVDSIVRIQFYTLINPETGFKYATRKYVPAVRCVDLYSDAIDPNSANYDETKAYEFGEGTQHQHNAWICPNMTEIPLYGNPWQIQSSRGQSLIMIINACPDAQHHDQQMLDNGLVNVTYTDTECAS